MKLYEIPKWSEIITPEWIVTFHHLDWMYSFCTVDWKPEGDNIAHLWHFQELEKDWDFYRLV